MQSPLHPLPWQLALAGYICGLFATTYAFCAALVACALGLAFARGRVSAFMLVCVVLGFAVGQPPTPLPAVNWNGEKRIHGQVDEVRTHAGQRLIILVKNVVDADTQAVLDGRLLWHWADPPTSVHRGQQFTAHLVIRDLHSSANFGLSSSQKYWERLSIRHRVFSRGEIDVQWEKDMSWRGRLLERVSTVLAHTPGAATIRALLFGDRLLLDQTFMERIRRAGLAHSLALSGLHLALAASLGYGAAWLVGWLFPVFLLIIPRQKLGALLALPLVFVYLWLGDFSVSLLRAALMLIVFAGHQVLGTRAHVQDSLFLALGALVLVAPTAVYDLSLQFSFLAVLGLVLFLPHVSGWLAPLREGGWLARRAHGGLFLAATSLCANLFLLPVLVLYFGEVSVHLWLNVLWLPVLGFVVLPLSFLGLLFLPVLKLSSCCFYVAGVGVQTLERGLAWLDQADILQTMPVLRPSGLEVIGYWMVLTAVSVLLTANTRRVIIFLVLGLSLLALPPLVRERDALRDQVELVILDTGTSQAVLLRAGGRSVLVDGGGSWNPDYDLGRVLVGPALTWKHPPQVDMVFLSHMDIDHLRGLFHILETFDVGSFFWSGLTNTSADCARLVTLLGRGAFPVRVVRAGERIAIGPDVRLDVLHPSDQEGRDSQNVNSFVLRLVWRGQTLALLPGDAPLEKLESLVQAGVSLTAQVLVLPHHGSRTGLDSALSTQIKAKWAVAACGRNNRFHFPHPEVVRACEAAGSTLLTTGTHGAIRFLWTKEQEPEVSWMRSEHRGGCIVSAGPFRYGTASTH